MLSVPPALKGKIHAPITNGFYKIINPTDGFVLTVTQEGRPGLRHVITEEWNGAPTQEWKVKNLSDGLQIIRNETIKDNEVSKEDHTEPEGGKKKFKPTEWNLVQQDDGTYEVFNGISNLHSHGKGERVSFDGDCEVPQRWEFVFLKELK